MAILAAIDETERSKRIVTIAYDLATTYDDTLIALHVIPEEESEQHIAAMQEISDFEDFSFVNEINGAKQFTSKFVRDSLPDANLERVEPRGRIGNVADQILEEVDRVDPRFLVISGRRRSPAGKAIFGDIAQRILLNAECPVVSRLSDA